MSGSSSRSAVPQVLRFGPEDLVAFAAASGDRNPLHLDPVFARRSPFGACIVHGSLVALALLGSLPEEALVSARSLQATFGGPVLVDEAATVEARRGRRPGTWEVRLTARGRVLTRVSVSDAETGGTRLREPGTATERPMRTEPFAPGPGEAGAGFEIAGAYRPGPELAEIARQWHVEALDPALLEGLAWASYVVGMELPGLRSLFAAASLAALPTVHAGPRGAHALRLRERDTRSGRLLVDGILYGTTGAMTVAVLEAFAREPVPPPRPVAISTQGLPAPSGEAVVVVGGSRGLGAELTLAFLDRGHAVHALYSTSTDAGAELVRLAGPHGERLVLHRVDARDPAALLALAVTLRSTGNPLRGLVLAAAPPPLAMGVTAQAAVGIADYVSRSVLLAVAPLGALLPGLAGNGFVLFCSSSALTAPPRDWPHYVAAKAALEGLARWTASAAPGVRSVVARLPKMLTDMTNSPSARLDAVSPEAVAVRLVGRLESGELKPGLTVLEPEQM